MVTKKMRYEEMKKNFSEHGENKKKMMLVVKKQSAGTPILIKEDNGVNGWEAEDDYEQNYGWL